MQFESRNPEEFARRLQKSSRNPRRRRRLRRFAWGYAQSSWNTFFGRIRLAGQKFGSAERAEFRQKGGINSPPMFPGLPTFI